jgi:hypothetical protein
MTDLLATVLAKALLIALEALLARLVAQLMTATRKRGAGTVAHAF